MMMHPGHYVPLPTSFSMSATGQQVARQDSVASMNHAPPASSVHVTSSSSSLMMKSVTGTVLLQFTGGLTSGTSTASTQVSSPTTTPPLSAALSPPSPTSTEHKPVFRPDNGVLTSTTCSGPITRTLSPTVKASSGSGADGLLSAYTVGPAVLDCPMKSELV